MPLDGMEYTTLPVVSQRVADRWAVHMGKRAKEPLSRRG